LTEENFFQCCHETSSKNKKYSQFKKTKFNLLNPANGFHLYSD